MSRAYASPTSEPAKSGSTQIYRCSELSGADLNDGTLQGAKTLYENLWKGVETFGNKNLYGTRKGSQYKWKTYAQIGELVTQFGSGLVKVLAENSQNRYTYGTNWNLAIYSVNREEWCVAEHAAHAFGIASVALYDTFGIESIEYIVGHAETPVVVCSLDKVKGLLSSAAKLPVIKVIISMDVLESNETNDAMRALAKQNKIALIDFKEVTTLGQQNILKHLPPKATDLATICYTSGTTGLPKGALLSHRNFTACGGSIEPLVKAGKLDDIPHVMVSYLPLAHCFERVMEIGMISMGYAIGFYRGDVLGLMEDLSILKPTVFPSVPRLLNRVYDKVRSSTLEAGGVKGILFRKAYAAKKAQLKAGHGFKHAIWDRILFSKVAAVIGGQVRIIVSGSAPLSGDVLDFLRIMFCTEGLEGYGQTENAAAATCQRQGDFTSGNVGAPLPCVEFKLMDVPEMNYTSKDQPRPRGEICFRGHNVFMGYHKDPAKTKEALDEDGWLHTGDIGIITEHGSVSIVDRKKNIFKLSQGEYIVPDRIEAVLAKSRLAQQVYLHGDSLQPYLVVVAVLNHENYLQTYPGFRGQSAVDVAKAPSTSVAILEEFTKLCKQAGLKGFEIPKAVFVTSELFSVENGILTPTFKVKRKEAHQSFKKEIDQLFVNLKAQDEASEKAKL